LTAVVQYLRQEGIPWSKADRAIRAKNDTVRAVFHPIPSLVVDVGRRNLVLNLATVEYLASLALGKLVMLNRKAQAAHGRLALCRLSPAVAQSLDSSASLTELFRVYGDEQEAVRSFACQGPQPAGPPRQE
jgi:anti-anti-sigma factor